jgi:hypothetical protein
VSIWRYDGRHCRSHSLVPFLYCDPSAGSAVLPGQASFGKSGEETPVWPYPPVDWVDPQTLTKSTSGLELQSTQAIAHLAHEGKHGLLIQTDASGSVHVGLF